MTDEQIYERLTETFHDVFDDEEIVVTPELTADDVEDWDSLAHIRLVLAIEKAFKVKFTAAEVGDVQDVGELVELIKRKL
jgi:acyl carrier protein